MGNPYEIVIGNLDATTRRQIGNSCHGFTTFEVNQELLRMEDIEDAKLLLAIADAMDAVADASHANVTAEEVAQARMDVFADLLGDEPGGYYGPDELASLEDHPFNADEA